MNRHASGIDVVNRSLWDGVSVISYFVFVAIAVFSNVIGQYGAPILEMDRIRSGTNHEQGTPKGEKGDTWANSGAF
jgi:hypothetical protein